MSKLTIYGSITNGGDGSAGINWFDSQELAEFDQDNMSEGWGESCTTSVTFEGDNLNCLEDVQSKEGRLVELMVNEDINLEKFRNQFFKNGTPKFKVKILDKNYYQVLFEGKQIHKIFGYPKKPNPEGAAIWEGYLNS